MRVSASSSLSATVVALAVLGAGSTGAAQPQRLPWDGWDATPVWGGRPHYSPAPTVRAVPVERPEHLGSFRRALDELRRGHRDHVRIAHYGDSNVAAGLWTRVTRESLQRRFGHGGAGFLTVVPFGSRPMGLPWLFGHGFEGRRYASRDRMGPLDGLWGLAGVAAEGIGTSAVLTLSTEEDPRAATLEIHALGTPNGGTFSIEVDGHPVGDVDTRTSRLTAVRRRVVLPAGNHEVKLRVTSWRPVRILGAVLEADEGGLVYDTLGINGQRMSAMLEWNRTLWQRHLEGRHPDLLVLGFGGNEALDPSLTMSRYRDQLEAAVARVRALMPAASCLMVAPVAMCNEPRRAAVERVQRQVAPRYGCALWNPARVSGGELCEWIRAGLVSHDRLHLNEEGYRVIGDAMADAILEVVSP